MLLLIIPVVNMLNIKTIASDEGLAVDPIPLPLPGEGGVYYETAYNKVIIAFSLLLIFAYAIVGVLLLGRKRKP